MDIVVDRFLSDDDATLSLVKVNDKFFCFGLEDEYRENKIPSETRIPANTYRIGIRDVGGFNQRYKKRFGPVHHGMLQVLDVPGFEYILIHIGNTDEDTAGCLLVGEIGCATPGEIRVNASTAAYLRLYQEAVRAADRDDLYITYWDHDR